MLALLALSTPPPSADALTVTSPGRPTPDAAHAEAGRQRPHRRPETGYQRRSATAHGARRVCTPSFLYAHSSHGLFLSLSLSLSLSLRRALVSRSPPTQPPFCTGCADSKWSKPTRRRRCRRVTRLCAPSAAGPARRPQTGPSDAGWRRRRRAGGAAPCRPRLGPRT